LELNALEYIYGKYEIAKDAPSPIQLQVCRVPAQVQLYAELGLRVGAEIGVDRGLFAADICKANPGVKLYGIDPWQDYPEYGEVYTQPYAEACYAEAQRRLAPYDVELIRKLSMEAVGQFADDELDFVYIDGNHAYQFVLDDITAWSRKVRPGGIVSGHDYCRPKNRHRWQFQGVIKAVNDYVKANGIDPWFIFRGKGCSGWLWVRE
jgi:hypothetical protein